MTLDDIPEKALNSAAGECLLAHALLCEWLRYNDPAPDAESDQRDQMQAP